MLKCMLADRAREGQVKLANEVSAMVEGTSRLLFRLRRCATKAFCTFKHAKTEHYKVHGICLDATA